MKPKGKPGSNKGKKFTLTGGAGGKPKNLKKRKQPSAASSRPEPEAKRPRPRERVVVADTGDKAFFEEHGQFLTFLDGMDSSNLNVGSKKLYKKKDKDEDSGDDLEQDYEKRGARREESDSDEEIAPSRLPVMGEDDELMAVDVDSDEEREKLRLRDQRAEEKEERLKQAKREKRERQKAAAREKRGLPPKEEKESGGGDEEEEGSEGSGEEDGAAEQQKQEKLIANLKKETPKVSAIEDDPDMLELRLFAQRQQEITKQKESMAALAAQVLEDPEQNMRKLRELHELCDAEDITIRKLAIVSELKIFHDIIPSYRIVVGVDNGVQLSKEVKKLREFENQILDCYQAFLTTLEGILSTTREILKANGEAKFQPQQQGQNGNSSSSSSAPNGNPPQSKAPHHKRFGKWRPSTVDISQMTPQGIEAMLGLGRVAAMAMGDLLARQHHFNFRSNIIMAMVPLLNTSDPQLSVTVAASIRKLFATDSKGASSLECARTISQLVKKKEYRVKPIVVDVLRALKLRKPLEEGDSIFGSSSSNHKKAKHISKKDKKQAKKDKELDKELKETEAVERKEDRDLVQTETLKVAFLLYFNILKNTKRSPLLPVVLEAMAHFSHLINLDLLLNLVELLKEVIADKAIPLESSMHTVITAFNAIKLQGDSLTVDLKDFYTYFYPLLEPAMAAPSKYNAIIPLLVRSLELMLTQRRILALDRVTAYAKRILTLSLHLPPQGALSILLVLNQILRKYPKTQQLLDTEISGMGTYMPEVEDPEHCNAFAATAWEFSLLTEHVHPSVTNLARMVLNQDPITEQNILKIYEQFDFGRNGIVPSMTKPRPHTFIKAMEKAKRAGRDNIYFIKPSEYYDPSDFAKKIDAQRSALLKRDPQPDLFEQHFHDVQSMMDIDMDDEIISSDEE
jgi:nucleolar complex protein 3